ncbi:replicative DNA helicase [Paucisalibacillus globulus]|uniref:replicative DNA helicase n=1 Tax=Paucisalibacillus globulus TaxID=351095 RepID=UPI0004151B87|nr:replicative DNA helicase [Paucisalibacillus globulus]
MIHHLEAEQAVIGTVLLEGALFQNLTLEAKHFYSIKHQKIFDSMRIVSEKQQEINVVTVVTVLEKDVDEIGGVSYLSQLAGSVPSTEGLKDYESAVFEAYRNRETSKLAIQYSENPSDESLHKLLTQLEKVKDIGIFNQEKTTKDILLDIAEKMALPPEESKRGFQTGYTDFDNMTGGLQPTDLIIIAARPSVGKTAFALNIASGHCENGGTSHIFSLEMGAEQLLQRIISAEANVDGQKWRTMNFSNEDYSNSMNAIGIISNWNLHTYEEERSINQIKASIRKAVQNAPDERHLVIIDYLQLITSTGRYERRDLEVGSMTRDLKLLAKELNTPIVLLSQLSRGVEQRQDKRPMMSDLRESGNIEQDADVVGFLYRDDYYNKESEKQNIIEIILSKQRNGPTGTVELAFLKEYGKFVNLARWYDGDGTKG